MYPTHALEEAIRTGLQEHGIPGIAVSVGTREHTLASLRDGLAQRVPEERPLPPNPLWDLASVSKVVGATTSLAILASEGKVRFDDTLAPYFPEVAEKPLGGVTLRQLLTHTGGLVSWSPLYKTVRGYEQMIETVLATDLATEPGAERHYSDLGFILLGEVVHRVSGQMIDKFAGERIFGPVGMRDTCYNPDAALQARCPATEIDPETALPVVGVVHDENTRAMGGISGHAGVFSTADDLALFAQALLALPEGPLGGAISAEVWADLQQTRPDTPSGYRRLGWDGIDPAGQMATIFSTRAFGHTGFTGTALWIDPGKNAFAAVLTNGVHPTREGAESRVYQARMGIYRAAIDLVEAAAAV